jgi:trimeric autotransporter adhesin
MSTKTTFKRIALVAVAALGLGVISVAPSSAAVINLTAVVANGTATTAASDSTTAATLAIKYTSQGVNDTVTVSSYVSAKPSASGNLTTLVMIQLDTATSTQLTEVKTNSGASGALGSALALNTSIKADSITAVVPVASTSATAAAKFGIYFDTYTGLKAGTYTITTVITPYNAGVAGTAITRDANIVVTAAAADVLTASAATSTAVLSDDGTPTVAGVDDAISTAAKASSTGAAVGIVRVSLKNSGSGNAQESVTATITNGVIGNGSNFGRSVTVQYSDSALSAGYVDLSIRSDGTAGVATITVASTSVTFASKTITFYAAAPKTITVKTNKPVIAVASAATNTDVVRATALDANGNVWGGQIYIQAVGADSATAGSTTPAACTFDPTFGYHKCPVSGQAAGTASLKTMDAEGDLDGTITAADATVISDAASVTVSTGVVSKITLAFDKSTYAPGEKAKILVTAVDAAGKNLPGQTILTALATGGITPSTAFSSGSDVLDTTTVVTSASTSSTSGTTAGSKTYTVYMPLTAGDVTISATGGNGVAAAGRVAITATASVVNSSVDAATDAANEATDAANAATDAALAAADAADAATAAAQDASDAVAALSASVSKLISSLRAQITSLTNLVIKIQKKVRA